MNEILNKWGYWYSIHLGNDTVSTSAKSCMRTSRSGLAHNLPTLKTNHVCLTNFPVLNEMFEVNCDNYYIFRLFKFFTGFNYFLANFRGFPVIQDDPCLEIMA